MKKLLISMCQALAAAGLFSIMLLTFLDVLGRKFAGNSIAGSLELTELLMVVVIFAGLPLVSERGEHVEFDSLDAWLPVWLRRVQAIAVHALCGTMLLLLGWLMWRTGGQFLRNGETTAQLHVLKAPFVYGMGVMCGVTGLVHLTLIWRTSAAETESDGGAL